jgi:hypothetical protein
VRLRRKRAVALAVRLAQRHDQCDEHRCAEQTHHD